MKNLLILSILIFSVIFIPSSALACSPALGSVSPSAQQFLDRSTTVFAGKAISVEKDNGYDNNNFLLATTTFEIYRYWKGELATTTKVLTINNTPSCLFPYDFFKGNEYLVFATYDPHYGTLITQIDPAGGTGTQLLEDASEYLKILGPSLTIQQGSSTPYIFLRNLSIGMSGEDVRQLQKYLNKYNYTVSVIGPGSMGNETTYFGPGTKAALIKFQTAQGDKLGLVQGTGYFGPLTRDLVNKLIMIR